MRALLEPKGSTAEKYTRFPIVEDIVGCIDTETTGSYLRHGDRMFFFSVTFNKPVKIKDHSTGKWAKGTIFCWEWPVDPLTRQPQIPQRDLDSIEALIRRRDITWVMHNALFDVGVICNEIDIDPVDFLSRCHDTMIMSHAWNSMESHGAKDLALKYFGISDADQAELKKCVNECRSIALALGWKIASKENLPHYGRAPKTGWWVIDMWLPAAVAEYNEYPANHRYRKVCPKYGNMDTRRGLALYFGLKKSLVEAGLWGSYMANRLSMIPCYTMGHKGLHIHEDRATKMRSTFNDLSFKVEHTIAASIGNRFFRPSSVTAIRQVLYHDFKLPVEFETKKGNPSTGKDVMIDVITKLGPKKAQIEKRGAIAFRPPIRNDIEPYSDYRKRLDFWSRNLDPDERCFYFCCSMLMWKKLRSTSRMIDSYLTKALEHHLYPRYNPTGTKSTRLSSSDPNGQNVSKGKKAFIEFLFDWPLTLRAILGPAEGYEWWSIDYKQLQLFIFAVVSKDEAMLDAMRRGEDFHTFMQKIIFGDNYIKGDDAQRTIAKNVNFGFAFGAQPAKIERTAHMPGLWKKLCKLIPGATSYIERKSKFVSTYGYVDVLDSYRLRIPDGKPYAGVNYEVQGGEGLIVKRAMLECYDLLCNEELKLASSIHDELLFCGPIGSGHRVIPRVQQAMVAAGEHFGVPCKVTTNYIEKSWAEGLEMKPGLVNLPIHARRLEDKSAKRIIIP